VETLVEWGILLGPEGTTRVGWVLWFQASRGWHTARVSGLVLTVGVVGWLWVENCIVDASILLFVGCRVFCVLVSCQGRTVDALAPGADEGRGRPR
jgi:hypothetical protein